MTVPISIDLNVRVHGNQTYAGFEDADGPFETGDRVLAVEEETGIVTDATVTRIDHGTGLVYLAVDWAGFRDDPEATEDPGCE